MPHRASTGRWRKALQLLGVLAAVLTIVVLLMLIISIVSFHLGMETGISVALFPMVILAMTIERASTSLPSSAR